MPFSFDRIHGGDHQFFRRNVIDTEVIDQVEIREIPELEDIILLNDRRRRQIWISLGREFLVFLSSYMLRQKDFSEKLFSETSYRS